MLNSRAQFSGQFWAKQVRLIARVTVLLGLFADFSRPLLSVDSPYENLSFSHRFHLTETKATCQDCHASVWKSSSSLDNNLPSEKNCLQCHDGAKARKECTLCHTDPKTAHSFQSPPRNFRFDHQLHGNLGNLAPIIAAAIDSGKYLSQAEKLRKRLDTSNPCVACHRGLDETNYSGPANLPQMADCLVCHAESIHPLVASSVIRKALKLSLSAIRPITSIYIPAEKRSWTNNPAKSAMARIFAAWAVTDLSPAGKGRQWEANLRNS